MALLRTTIQPRQVLQADGGVLERYAPSTFTRDAETNASQAAAPRQSGNVSSNFLKQDNREVISSGSEEEIVASFPYVEGHSYRLFIATGGMTYVILDKGIGSTLNLGNNSAQSVNAMATKDAATSQTIASINERNRLHYSKAAFAPGKTKGFV